ncbi:MAG: UDP-N-acetylmuramate--L-alanine ligase [Bacteroidales bacterium]
MSALQNIRHIYFLGIGGIGMSALARYFRITGKTVAGYDRTPTQLTRQLSHEGITIHYEDDPGLITGEFQSPDDTWVILTPAIPPDHAELAWFRKNRYKIFKRSEILGLLSKGYKTVAVAGTHGKTTVSTMIAHILAHGKTGCNAFLGGISKNYDSNLILNPQSDWMVTEADEFDRSFLQLHPYAAVVTAMDPDHLDIYGNAENMQQAFNQFIGQIDREGFLLLKGGLPVDPAILPSQTYTYSLNGNTDFRADNIRLDQRRYYFDLTGRGIRIKNLSLEHPGLVNVENAVAATAMAALLKTDYQQIRQSIDTFSGIQRRFDYHIKTGKIVYIDDYAHHPMEIEATLRSVRELYPGKKITGIFQPHLYSRTKDLAKGFANSLGLLDSLILLDIYPARELPIEGVTSELVFRDVQTADKIMCSKEELLEVLQKRDIEVLITLGAGDIDKYTEPITQLLQKRIG